MTGPRWDTLLTGALTRPADPDQPAATAPPRRVLAGLLLAALAASGCSATAHPASLPVSGRPAVPSTDELAQIRAVQDSRAVLALAAALPRPRGRLARAVAAVQAGERTHLAALGLPAGAPGQSPDHAPGPAVDPAPGLAAASVAEVVEAQTRAAGAALIDLDGVSPGTATLLARIAAGRAADALLLARAAGRPAPALPADPVAGPPARSTPAASPAGTTTTAPGLPPPDADAVFALLAGEHAAVFGYAVIAARLDSSRRPAADRAWAAHETRRDALEQYLVDLGIQPPAAAAAYDLGPLPQTPEQAVQLATRIEDGLARVAAGAVGPASGGVRPLAAGILIASARTSSGWSGRAPALPGGPALTTATRRPDSPATS